MAEIFVSYTSQDRDWAFWIGQELEKLGHVARIDAWEIPGGGNIMAWMLERLQSANHVLCVISEDYFKGPFASAEFQAALWAAQKNRQNFLLPVRIANCELHYLLDPLKRCDLFGIDEDDARQEFIKFLKPAGKPRTPTEFPGDDRLAAEPKPKGPVAFPGFKAIPAAISNIPINLPWHFFGRENELAAIEKALENADGPAAITALRGLRGVGKTVLAAAYAARHSRDYRVTWWIRAETEPTIRADLAGLGVRLGWVKRESAEAFAEEQSVDAVSENGPAEDVLNRMRREGDGILLIYDNALGPHQLMKFLPRGSGAKIIITSNAPNWRGVAEPIEIKVWPMGIGADFLIARTGRATERDEALALSEDLDGLPLAHEQAAAYCERVGTSIAEYRKLFEGKHTAVMDDARDAPPEYYDGLTVARSFALAIDKAAKLHAGAERLIVYAAHLSAEPIPLYLFSEGRGGFPEPFASSIGGDDRLNEAVGALRAFALIDRELITDEENSTVTTDCIRLHRLVRQVASAKCSGEAQRAVRRDLIRAMARLYDVDISRDPVTWPRARRLDPLSMDLVAEHREIPEGAEAAASRLLDGLASYRHVVLGAYASARPLFERALGIVEKLRGKDHLDTTSILNNLALLLQELKQNQAARSLCERALAIREKELGPEHPETAVILNTLGVSLRDLKEFASAKLCYERSLAINERYLGAEHRETAKSLNNLGAVLREMRDYAGARACYDRALAIREKVLGPDHPDTATLLNNIAFLLRVERRRVEARPYYESALAIREKVFGRDHPATRRVAIRTAALLDELRLPEESAALRRKFAIRPPD